MPKLLHRMLRGRAERERRVLMRDIQRLRLDVGDILLVRLPRDIGPDAAHRAKAIFTDALESIGRKNPVLLTRDDVQIAAIGCADYSVADDDQ